MQCTIPIFALLLTTGCAALRPSRGDACFVALPITSSHFPLEPRWLELNGFRIDSTGEAVLGLWGRTRLPGTWRRYANDSVGIEADSPFDHASLVLLTRDSSASGRATIRTDAGTFAPNRLWRGQMTECVGSTVPPPNTR